MRSLSWAALLLLAACGGPVPNIKSADPYERYLGEKDLAANGDAASMGHIVELLEDPHYLVVVGALEVLAQKGQPEFLQHAVAKLKHKHPMVREQACATMGAIRNPEGIPALLETLKDPEPSVRRAACKALRQFVRRPEIDKALIETVGDKDPSVAYMAHLVLCEITGLTKVARTKEAWTQALK